VPAALESGTTGLAFAYGVALLGIWAGLTLARAPLRRMLWLPLLAVPTVLGAAALWSVIQWTSA
jgi:hypothetical protein